MDERRDLDLTRPWMREGTGILLGLVAAMADDELAELSLLPGWTRAHVVAHAALNAQALGRLVHWAVTGEETPMYATPGQREADIEAAASLPAPALRALVVDESAALSASLAELSDAAWAATVRTREGREIPAAEIPWMRVREVWVHSVDLGAGFDCDRFPRDLALTLLGEAAARLARSDSCPALRLLPDGGSPVIVGDGEPIEVAGDLGDLLGWLIGRSDGARLSPAALPGLPAWL